MNERIKQLAEQAGFEITPWGNESVPCVHQEGPIDVELEKFAELILRELIDKISQEQDIAEQNWQCKNGVHICHELTKHFGVE